MKPPKGSIFWSSIADNLDLQSFARLEIAFGYNNDIFGNVQIHSREDKENVNSSEASNYPYASSLIPNKRYIHMLDSSNMIEWCNKRRMRLLNVKIIEDTLSNNCIEYNLLNYVESLAFGRSKKQCNVVSSSAMNHSDTFSCLHSIESIVLSESKFSHNDISSLILRCSENSERLNNSIQLLELGVNMNCISIRSLKSLVFNFRHLQKIEIKDDNMLTNHHLEMIAMNCRKLASLFISCSNRITSTGFRKFVTFRHKFKSLSLIKCLNVDITNMVGVIQISSDTLRSLQLYIKFNEESVIAIFSKSFPLLEVFDVKIPIFSKYTITDKVFFAMSKSCRELSKVSLSSLPKDTITRNAIAEIIKTNQKLKEIIVNGSNIIV